MAVVNLELSALNLETFPEAYGKLIDGINERISILDAMGIYLGTSGSRYKFYGYTEEASIASGDPMNPKQVPSASKMNSVIRAIRNLATYFCNPDEVTFKESYTDFPHTYLSELKKQSSEHSIGYCVGRTQCLDETTLDNWKQMFREAAYWLNRMTMIRVPSNYTYRECTEITDNPYSDVDINSAITPQPASQEYEKNKDPRIYITYKRVRSNSDPNAADKKHWTCYTGLVVTNRAPWDATCRLYFVCPSWDAADTKWDGVFPAGWRVLNRRWNQPQKWQYLTRSIEIDDGAYKPYPQDYPDTYFFTDRLEIEETQVLLSGDWATKKSSRTHAIYSGGADDTQVSKTIDSFEKNFSPDGDEEILLTQESTTEGPDSGQTGCGTPKNDLQELVYLWNGFGLVSDLSSYLSESVPAHTKKKLTCLSFNQIPEDIPDFDDYVGSEWTHGNHYWYEHISIYCDVRIVPIMDYTDSITTFNVVDSVESSGNAPEGNAQVGN